MKKYKNILVVRTDRIGDVVLTTPSFLALREAYPSARISVLVSATTRALVEGNPHIDQVFIDDRKENHRGVFGFFRLVSLLKEQKFDCAIIFHAKRRANLCCYLAKIVDRIGYRNNKYGFLLTIGLKDERHYGVKHESQYCLDLLKSMGINISKFEFFIPLQKESENWVKEWQKSIKIKPNKKLVAIHAGASCFTKCWSIKSFCELIDKMKESYDAEIVLIGASNVIQTAKDIENNVSGSVVNMVGKTSLGQLISLLKRCNLLISNDSGPVHIAAALGIRVISLFLRDQPGINPERWKPVGNMVKTVISKSDKAIRLNREGSVVSGEFDSIEVNEVLEAVDDLFKLC